MAEFFEWIKYWVAKIVKMFDQTKAWLDNLDATETTTQG